jgi:hypothetical protein
MSAGGLEPEARVVVSVPHDDDEGAAGLGEPPVARLDQLAADTLALVFRNHGHGPQRRSRHDVSDVHVAVHDVTDHPRVRRRDQGKESCPVRPQCLHDVPFLVLPECAPVHVRNGCDIIRMLFANLHQVGSPCPPNARLQPRRLTMAAAAVGCKPC